MRKIQNELNEQARRPVGLKLGLIVGLAVACLITVNLGLTVEQDVDSGSWVIYSGNIASAENAPGSGVSGVLSVFLLDYGQVPGTVLANNATDWSSSGDVHAYADSDGFSESAVSEDAFYPVVRVRFNKTHAWDTDKFIGADCRCKITVSGCETISAVYGTAVVSQNSTSDDYIWINFYWDDAVDGYVIPDDGTFTISSIVVEAKF